MAQATTLDAALLAREAWLERAGRRWNGLAHLAALAFVTMLYSNPMYWWPWFGQLRLAFAASAVAALAVVMHRLTAGEHIRVGGWGSIPLFAYLAVVPASLAWTISSAATGLAVVEASKMAIIYVAIQNAVETPGKLRRFLLVAALASLGPALGGIHVWRTADELVEGYRTHWRGMFGDPNWLAMSLVAVLPFALLGALRARSRAARVLFGATAVAQLTTIVLTHSRSGSIAAALAVLLYLGRGRGGLARGAVASVLLAASLAAFAPETFWERSRTLENLEEDESLRGRENAWKVLGVIVEERPLTGVGAGAFLPSWGRYAPLAAGGHRYVAHNVLLEIVGELGIPAFALFAAFAAGLLVRVWRVGADPLVGDEARAIFAALAGFLLCEMANGYSFSWFLYFLFACGAAAIRLSRVRRALLRECA